MSARGRSNVPVIAGLAVGLVVALLMGLVLLGDDDDGGRRTERETAGPANNDPTKTPPVEPFREGDPRKTDGIDRRPDPVRKTSRIPLHRKYQAPTPNSRRDPKHPSLRIPAAKGSRPVVVRMRCEDESGNPLSGVRIQGTRGQREMPLDPVVTDARGEAVLRGLPEGERVQVSGRHPHCRDAIDRAFAASDKGLVVLGPFRVSALGRLSGVLQDQDGNPVTEGELVLARGDSKAILDTAAMGLQTTGRFDAQVAAGKWTVSARGKGYGESDRMAVTISPDEESGPITLVVAKQGALAGQVTLPPDLANLHPLELVLVMEITMGPARNPYTKVRHERLELDASYRYQVVGCDPGAYRMRLEVPAAGGSRVGPWMRFNLAAGQQKGKLDLAITEVMVSIQGVVRDDLRRPLEGAQVTVRSRKVMTDRDGRYALRGLNMGSAGVKATLKGHASAYEQVVYKGSRLTVDLTLARTGEITGLVTGESVGQVPVIAIAQDEDGVETFPGTTDGQGRYRIQNLPPGRYFLKAGKGADPFTTQGALPVQVQPGRTVTAPDLSIR